MATLRNWLNKAGFDWENGKILYQQTKDESAPGYSFPVNAKYIKNDDQILDKDFNSGFGFSECPRIIAEDNDKFYFPVIYDGFTRLKFIYKDISKYLDFKNNETPYFWR